MSTTATFPVTGMTCGHCASSVTEEVAGVSGVTAVRVTLVAGGTSQVTVDSDTPVDAAEIRAAVREAGYEVAGS
jgi:copper chaperone CopZ